MEFTRQFIITNPEITIVIFIISLLITRELFKLLIKILTQLVTQPYKDLTSAIQLLNETMTKIKTDFQIMHEKDQNAINKLDKRLTTQEAICQSTHNFCPYNITAHNADKQLKQ